MTDKPSRFNKHRPKICGAKTKTGNICQNTPMKNGRCQLHGGLSTGPKTELGRRNCGNWKHGRYSKQAMERKKIIQQLCQNTHELIQSIS